MMWLQQCNVLEECQKAKRRSKRRSHRSYSKFNSAAKLQHCVSDDNLSEIQAIGTWETQTYSC